MNDHYIQSGIGWGGSGVGRAGNRVVAAALVAVVVAAGCGTNLPPAPPTTPPAASAAQGPTATVDPRAWAFAGVVQPDVVTQAPSLQPGYHCSPCHPAAASQLFGITATSDGFLAVGVQQPPAEAILLASADGRSLSPSPAGIRASGRPRSRSPPTRHERSSWAAGLQARMHGSGWTERGPPPSLVTWTGRVAPRR